MFWNLSVCSEKLLEYYTGSMERVGFILSDGSIVECTNVSPEPESSFIVSAEEIVAYCDRAVATWHTHPDADYNLSANDYEMFMSWPDLDHYIVGNNGVRKYVVEDGDLIIA